MSIKPRIPILDLMPDDEEAYSIEEMSNLIKQNRTMVVRKLCSPSIEVDKIDDITTGIKPGIEYPT